MNSPETPEQALESSFPIADEMQSPAPTSLIETSNGVATDPANPPMTENISTELAGKTMFDVMLTTDMPVHSGTAGMGGFVTCPPSQDIAMEPQEERPAKITDVDKASRHTKKQHNFQMTKEVFHEIEQTIGRFPSERGGMLGGCRQSGRITHYFFDRTASCSGVTYSPDTDTVNPQLQSWNAQGIDLIGFVHSHPGSFGRPSGGDLVYAKRIIAHCESMEIFYMPIINTKPESGKFSMFSYCVNRAGQLLPATHELI